MIAEPCPVLSWSLNVEGVQLRGDVLHNILQEIWLILHIVDVKQEFVVDAFLEGVEAFCDSDLAIAYYRFLLWLPGFAFFILFTQTLVNTDKLFVLVSL